MEDMNVLHLSGRLTRDGELKYTSNGMAILELSMASTRKNDEVVYMDCSIFGERAEKLAEYMTKGKPMILTGQLKLDRWEKDGQKFSKHCMLVEKIVFLSDGKRYVQTDSNAEVPAMQ